MWNILKFSNKDIKFLPIVSRPSVCFLQFFANTASINFFSKSTEAVKKLWNIFECSNKDITVLQIISRASVCFL